LRTARSCTGNFFIDANVLREEGVTDLSAYAVDPKLDAVLDFFLERPISPGVRKADFFSPDGG
jgi:citronellol/citronellal dehydrogenase